jgi:DNA-directed RNA polymerase specialized sigma24 family protein
MLAKEVMQNGIDIDNRIKEQLAFYKHWEALADEFEDGVLLNIVEDARTELIDLILMKKNIEDIIMSNNNRDQRQILRMRYLENLSWQCIAEELCEDVDWTKEQHHKALKKIHLEHSCECCHAEEE